MKIFISYGSASDQVTALRLQALAAVNGLDVYVPPANTRQSSGPFLDLDSAQKVNESDVVLGVIGPRISEACRQELNTSLALHKPTIAMVDPLVAPQLQPVFSASLVVVDPASPEQAEIAIVQHLKAVDAEQNVKKALIALGTLALGLLIFAPQD